MRIAALVLLAAVPCAAQITATPNLRARIDFYAGTNLNLRGYALDAFDRNNVKIIDWDQRLIGKPAPTNNAQLPSDAVAKAWKEAQKTDHEKEREAVDSLEKLQAEVIALRKEIEALKKEKQR